MMNSERGMSDGVRVERARWNVGLLWGKAALVRIGLAVGLLMAFIAPVSSAWAARTADVPCEVCAEASDPVQYTFAASRARDGEIARLRGLAGPGAAGRVKADETAHLRGLLEAAASSASDQLAREAEIARLRGLAGPGAASRVRADETVHLRGLLEAAASSGSIEDECALC